MSKRVKYSNPGKTGLPKTDYKICDMYIFSPSLLNDSLKVRTSLFLDELLFEKDLIDNPVSEKKVNDARKKLFEDRFNNVYDVLDTIHDGVFKKKYNECLFFAKIESHFIPEFCMKTINIEDQSEAFDGYAN